MGGSHDSRGYRYGISPSPPRAKARAANGGGMAEGDGSRI